MNHYSHDGLPIGPGTMLASDFRKLFSVRFVLIISDTLRCRVDHRGKLDTMSALGHINYSSPSWRRIA